MSEDIVVETHVDADIRDRAAKVFEDAGLTMSDAVRLFLTRTAEDGAVPIGLEPPGYDAWFRAKVQEALDDPRPPIPDEEVRARFAKYRAELLARIENGET